MQIKAVRCDWKFRKFQHVYEAHLNRLKVRLNCELHSDRYGQHGKSYYDMTVGTSTILNVHHAVHLRNTLTLSNPFASNLSYDSLPFDN